MTAASASGSSATGPTKRPGVSWLVVLYRSRQIQNDGQLVGYASFIDEVSYARLTPEEMNYLANDIWDGAINEAPGTDLPAECLNPGGIAWWRRARGWSAETGPPNDGLPATRIHVLAERPRDVRVVAINAVREAFLSSDKPGHLRYVETSADFTGVEIVTFFDEPVDELAHAYAGQLDTNTAAYLPDGLSVFVRAAYLPPGQTPPPHDASSESPTVERDTITRRRPSRAQRPARYTNGGS